MRLKRLITIIQLAKCLVVQSAVTKATNLAPCHRKTHIDSPLLEAKKEFQR